MNIGFTSTTFRNIRSHKKIVEIALRAGVDCIEWGADVHVKDVVTAKMVKKLCDDAGINICSYGSYYRVGSKDIKKWEAICQTASAMNAAWVRVWLGTCDSEKTNDVQYRNIAEDARAICQIAEKYGLLVCPECHDNTFNNNTDAFLKIQRDVDCHNFKTYFQSRYKKKEYDLDRIERTIQYINCVHVSYSELRREQFPKYDPTYMNALIQQLTEMKFDGTVLLEYTYLFGYFGVPSCLIQDIQKLKKGFGVKL